MGPPHPRPMGPQPAQLHVATQPNMMHGVKGTSGGTHGGNLSETTTTVNTMTQSEGGGNGGCKSKRCKGKQNMATASNATKQGSPSGIEVGTQYSINGDHIRQALRHNAV